MSCFRQRPFATATLTCVTALATFVMVAWAAWARPELERALSQRSGHGTRIGAIYPSVRDGHLVLVLRQVRILGKAPFDREALATCDRIEVSLGEQAALRVEGLDLALLMAPAADNVRGARARSPGVSSRKGPRRWPKVHVVSGRLTAQVALPEGQRLALRVPELEADVRADGGLRAELRGAVADVAQVATLRLARLAVDATADGDALVEGKGFAVQLPGGRDLIDGVMLEGLRRAGGFALALKSAPGQRERLHAQLQMSAQSMEIDVQAADWALAGLAPMLDDLGVGTVGATGAGTIAAIYDREQARVSWQTALDLRGLTFHHPTLDRHVWAGAAMRGEAHGRFDLAERKLTVEAATLAPLSLPVHLSGWVRLDGSANGSLSLRTPADGWACATLLGHLPAPLARHMAGLQMDGRLNAAVDVAFDAGAWEKLALDFRLPSTCTVRQEPRRLEETLDVLLKGEGGFADRPELPVSATHPDFTPIAKLPTHVLAAFLTAEDAGFFLHNGFEPENIRRALVYNIERGRFVRGASTITQQVAKNLFLSHQRTFARKAAEALLSWRLEALVPKRRLLEMYLNLVELGPGIHGVGAAARAYFGKEAALLSPLEAAHLASLPPNPQGFARRFREGSVDEGWLARLYDLLGIMGRRGHLSAAQVTAARASRLRLRKI